MEYLLKPIFLSFKPNLMFENHVSQNKICLVQYMGAFMVGAPQQEP